MTYDIPLIKPYFPEETKQSVADVLDSGHLTEGEVTREFEASIARCCGARHGIAVTSCTTGLELALRCLGIGPGDEVIVPDFTYPATASVVMIVGATAVLVDVSPKTMLIDYDAIENAVTKKTRAIIPVSLFGNPLDWGRLMRIKERYGLFIVEDAACGLGSTYDGRSTGSLADISVFSHHPRKFITTGEGGTITTNSDAWAGSMRSYKHFGMDRQADRDQCVFRRVGTNYKMSDLLAAVGLQQMVVIDDLLSERRRLADIYRHLFSGSVAVGLPDITTGGMHSWQTFCVFVRDRDRIMVALRGQGIEVQIGTYALHRQPAFTSGPVCRHAVAFGGSDWAYMHCLALPLYRGMTMAEQQRVGDALKREVGR